MSEPSTYILLDRNIVNWGWYKNANTAHLFIYCLLRANVQDQTFEGVVIHRGEFVSSYAHMSKDTGLSPMQCRTALKHLEKTGEITKTSTSKFTVINVVKYDTYQNYESYNNKQANKRITSKQQATNKQVTTINTDNTVNTVNTVNKRVLSPEEIEEIRRQ